MMLFKVYYTLRDVGGHVTRGGERPIHADSQEFAENIFLREVDTMPEYKAGNTLDYHTSRMFSEYLSWAEAIRALSTMEAAEINELLAAVNAAKAEVK